MKTKAQFNIPTKLFNEFKYRCRDEGRTMGGAITMLIKVWIKGLKKGG